MIDNARCSDCRYHQGSECRYNPPVVVENPKEIGQFPIVRDKWWCRLFKRKVEGASDV